NGIARLNSNGSVDSGFDPGTGVTGTIPGFSTELECIVVQPDGKVLIGGVFTSVNGTSRTRFARLNANGSLDTGFNPVLVYPGIPDYAERVRSVVLQPDGKLLIGGDFISVNGTNRNRIARLNSDGSLDTSFDPGTGFDLTAKALLQQPDGRIVVAGYFTSF